MTHFIEMLHTKLYCMKELTRVIDYLQNATRTNETKKNRLVKIIAFNLYDQLGMLSF